MFFEAGEFVRNSILARGKLEKALQQPAMLAHSCGLAWRVRGKTSKAESFLCRAI
jgi:hypothetical protein